MRTTKIKIHRILICSLIVSKAFVSLDAKEFEARYWFDSDSDKVYPCKTTSGNIEVAIPNDGLPNKAIHQINYQIKDSDGQWSIVYSGFFTYTPTSPLSLSYNFDGAASHTPLDLTTPIINGENLKDGIHHVTLTDKSGKTLPTDQLFFKSSSIESNLLLSMESTRNGLRKEMQITSGTTEVTMDVSDLDEGMYPIDLKLKNLLHPKLLKSSSSIVNINPLGGEQITAIHYWLNDSVGENKVISIPNGSMPFAFSTELNVADLSVPTSDYNLMLGNPELTVTPNFNIGVALMSNRGFRVDTLSYFKDNSKAEVITPVMLQSDVQYDFGQVSPQDNLWVQIPVQEKDEVRFLPRWHSTVKWFDNSATPIDTTFFTDSFTTTTFTSDYAGRIYGQIYDIRESIQDFSVKMKYTAGPSMPKIEEPELDPEITYEGIPVEWSSANEWSVTEEGLSLSKAPITMLASAGKGEFEPEVTDGSALCRINKNNLISFTVPSGYFDKITLCIAKECLIPEISASQGYVSIDRNSNIVVWEGLSKDIEFVVKDFYSSESTDESQIPELMIKKAYVRISDIGDDLFSLGNENLENPDLPGYYDYEEYNYLRVYNNSTAIGEYVLTEDTSIKFSDTDLVVTNDGKSTAHHIDDQLILICSYEEDITGTDDVEAIRPTVTISNGQLIFSGLPLFVGLYTIDGLVIFQSYVDNPEFTYPVADLTPGIYIVKLGSSSSKIIIK